MFRQNRGIEYIIDDINTNANGANCTIQFGDGSDVLDIGSERIRFWNYPLTWGVITLTGKITSIDSYTITIQTNVSINSTADIGNTKSGGATATISNGTYEATTGTLTINGGTVSGKIYNSAILVINDGSFNVLDNSQYGTLNIKGRTISSIGTAGSSAITPLSISAGGTVNISGGTITAVYGSFAIQNSGTLTITNGTVQNTGFADPIAVSNLSTDTVTIHAPPAVITGGTQGTIIWVPPKP